MASPWSVVLTFFFFCILLLETICSSGASLDCSYGSAQVKILSSSVLTEQQNVYLFLKPFQRSCRVKQLAGSFVNVVVVPNLRLNVSGVVVTANERQLGALRSTLESVQASLAAAGLDKSVKISPELSLPSLRAMAKSRRSKKHWRRVMEFVRRSGSFVVVEMGTEDMGGLAVVAEVIQEAVADVAAVLEDDVGVAFRLKSRLAPNAAEMARLIGDAIKGKRLMGVLAEGTPPRRELAVARTTAHDVFAPVTNPTTMPATNPVTVPATNPAMNPVTPGIVTVPSTNPATGYSNNSNLPPLYPEPTPVTMPDPTTTTPTPFMNPVTAPTMPSPVTNPAAPATNPTTTPAVTNPTTMPYPYPQQGGMPTTPTTPGTVQPAAPTVAGQTWCVAKTGLTDAVLQNGLDYACGIGGVDCSAIQPMGNCYNPNTLQAHASYAFNSYFQRNPSPTSCDFGGAGMLVNMNPSSGTCMFQTSAGYGAGYSPAVTGTVPVGGAGAGVTPIGPAVGSGSGPTVLNANSSSGGNSMYGSDNPTSLTGGAASLSCGWVLCLIWIFTFAFVKEKV